MASQKKFKSFTDLLNSVDEYDAYGFKIRQWNHWKPESLGMELERLEMNLAFYEQFILHGQKFPPAVNQARTDEYMRIRQIKVK